MVERFLVLYKKDAEMCTNPEMIFGNSGRLIEWWAWIIKR
jgi:hypothetical protein